jgi:flagellar biosynthesis protein FliQ
MQYTWYDSISFLFAQALTDVASFLPRIVAALLILIVGGLIAKIIKRSAVHILKKAQLSGAVSKTPVDEFLKNADVGQKIEDILGSLLYWILMLVVIHSAVAVLGLSALSVILEKVLNYLPKILAAIIVLFFGVLLAGIVETLVKGAVRSVDGQRARSFGKIASYMVVGIAVLAAISELQIAQEFILILFVGFVVSISLGVGLAVGLGGQDLVRKVLNQWYEKIERDTRE